MSFISREKEGHRLFNSQFGPKRRFDVHERDSIWLINTGVSAFLNISISFFPSRHLEIYLYKKRNLDVGEINPSSQT